MNRRVFLTGLLASTAAIPIVKAAPVTMRFTSYGGGFAYGSWDNSIEAAMLNNITRERFEAAFADLWKDWRP